MLLFFGDSLSHSEAPTATYSLQFETSSQVDAAEEKTLFVSASCESKDRAVLRNHFKYRAVEETSCIGVYSKYPLVHPRFPAYGDDLDPVLATEVQILPTQSLSLLVIRFPNAFSQNTWNDHRITLRRISTDLRHSQKATLVIGEFASTAFGRIYESFVDAARIEDAYWGRDLVTLAAIRFPYGSPTRHALYKGPIVPEDFILSGTGFFLSFNLLPDSI